MLRRTVDSELLAEIAKRIETALHPEQIILFGSYAWGQPNDDSDVDLFVIVPESDEPPHRRARAIYRSLRGIGVPVDAVVLTRDEVERSRHVRSSLAAKVLAEGRVLHG
jgi:predicted nucleotidyltransferase